MTLQKDQTSITQIPFNAAVPCASYCRFYRYDPVMYEYFWDTPYDTEHVSITGSFFPLWQDPADVLYVGSNVPFAFVGFQMHTPGDYGAFSIEYSADYDITVVSQGTKTFTVAENISSAFPAGTKFHIEGSTGNDGYYTVVSASWTGTATAIIVSETIANATADGAIKWISLTPVHVGTSNFTQSGYFAWVIPGAWAADIVDGQSAYWIRVYTAQVTAYAVAYSLLRSLTLNAPIRMMPSRAIPFIGRDINGDTFRRDIPQRGADRLVIDCTQIAAPMKFIHLLYDWWHYGTRVYVQSGAFTDPIGTTAFQTDAYAHAYKGRIVGMPPGMATPGAMDIPQYWQIEIEVDEIETLTGRLGVTV